MIRLLSITIALLTSATYANATHSPLHMLLKERLASSGDLPKMDYERTWAITGMIPFQHIEYRVSHGDENNKKYYYNPLTGEGSERHMFRLHIKNWQEMTTFSESRSLSHDIVELQKKEIINQRQFDAYLDLVNDLLHTEMAKVLDLREGQLQKTVERSGQILGLPKADVKDLVKELDRLQKVSAESEGIKALVAGATQLNTKEAQAVSKALVDSVGALAKKIAAISEKSDSLKLEHNSLEVRLQRIDKEVSWSEDRKILDHIDYQRDTINREDSIRITFNIPFIRFDNETRARDRALLSVKEAEVKRKADETNAELKRKRALVYGLAAQVESLKSRLGKTREISSKIKNVRDVELRSVLSDFSFDLERDVLVQALKFYTSYLEYLRDIGAFARMSNVNLLDPNLAEMG